LGLTRVADDGGAGGLELLERGRHCVDSVGGQRFHETDEYELLKKRSRERDARGKKVANRRYLEEGRWDQKGDTWRAGQGTYGLYSTTIVNVSTWSVQGRWWDVRVGQNDAAGNRQRTGTLLIK
jgi:hypothetical protein